MSHTRHHDRPTGAPTRRPRQRRSAIWSLLLATGAIAVLSLPACRGERSDDPPRQFLPDMDSQQKFRPQSQSTFFPDGRAMRPVVEGAVPFGRSTAAGDPHRDSFLKADTAFSTGMDAGGKYLVTMPDSAIDAFAPPSQGGSPDRQAAAAAMLKRGQQRFNIYCSACHGYQGDGHGMVGERWSGGAAAVANYHQAKYLDRSLDTGKDGYIFHTIREGTYDVDPQTKERKYRMPPYGHAVSETDAWAIVAYVRALQASWATDLDKIPNLTAEKRRQLDSTRPAAPAAAPAAPATPAQPSKEAPR